MKWFNAERGYGFITWNGGEDLFVHISALERSGLTGLSEVRMSTAVVLAFVPLTFSALWGSMAYTLIGGVAGGTVLTLVFLPALNAIWFKVKPVKAEDPAETVPIDSKLAA